MRKRTALAIGLLAVCTAGPAAAQAPADYMQQAVENVLIKAAVLQETIGMSLVEGGISVLGGFMAEGERIGWTTTFRRGTRYALVGGGDEDVRDLDIAVHDEAGNLLWQDIATDNYPVVEFEPSRTGRFHVYLKLYDAPEPSFAALAILSDDGAMLPIGRLDEAVRNYRLQVGVLTAGLGLRGFHEEANQWALFGAILADGEDTAIQNMSLETGRHVVAASGDDSAEDLDLILTDDARSGWKCEDVEPDPVPLIDCRTRDSGQYRLRIDNYDSSGPSLVIATILEP